MSGSKSAILEIICLYLYWYWRGMRSHYRFNPATCLCLSENWTYIFNAICRDLFVLNGFRREVIIRFVDIGEIVDYDYKYMFFNNKKSNKL